MNRSCNGAAAMAHEGLDGNTAAHSKAGARMMLHIFVTAPQAHHRLKVVQHCAADAKLLLNLSCSSGAQ